MTTEQRSDTNGGIFRPEAVEHHRAGEDAVRLPHYATLPVRAAMWGLIGTVLLAAGVSLTLKVPRLASGTAVISGGQQRSVLVVLMPPSLRQTLHPGERLDVSFQWSPRPVSTTIAFVLPHQMGTAQAAAALGLPGLRPEGSGSATVVAFAPLPPGAASAPARSIGQVSLQAGRQTLLSLVTR